MENQTNTGFSRCCLILGGACLILGIFLWYGGGESYNEEVERLRAENAKLQLKRKELERRVDSLHVEYKKLEAKDDSLANKISSQEKEIARLYANSQKSQAALAKMRNEIAEALRNIEKAKQNPPNRTGEELLNSLKIKSTKK